MHSAVLTTMRFVLAGLPQHLIKMLETIPARMSEIGAGGFKERIKYEALAALNGGFDGRGRRFLAYGKQRVVQTAENAAISRLIAFHRT
ncbi:hypothetical protein GCM10011491_41020 [Brucella endophytica]|uniref:Uncharacterized protein n=1 Tax=Brucella endophytica TaxID=1963359 RepID=A0A916SQM1_9HYPH|nr:hypothetical protein GCM10011491_41020 [Brucella endophytica]